MRASLALALLSFIATPTILAYSTPDGAGSSFARRSLATTYDDLMVREIADAVVSTLSRRGNLPSPEEPKPQPNPPTKGGL
jgi:hypothetical protein